MVRNSSQGGFHNNIDNKNQAKHVSEPIKIIVFNQDRTLNDKKLEELEKQPKETDKEKELKANEQQNESVQPLRLQLDLSKIK